MKNRIPILLALACVLLAMLFLVLWLHARKEADQMELLAQASAQKAATRSTEYQTCATEPSMSASPCFELPCCTDVHTAIAPGPSGPGAIFQEWTI